MVAVPHVFATTAAQPPPPASQLDDNFNALVAAINAISIAAGVVINAQTGTSYPVVASDLAKLLTFTNGSAIAVTIPQATGAFASPWFTDVTCLKGSVGAVTITPTTSTIDGIATLVVQPGESVRIISDSTNYQIARGLTPFARSFNSGVQTITSAGNLTLPHGLTITPRLPLVQVYLTCITGENNWNTGDKVIVPPGIISDGTASRGAAVTIDATNLAVRFGTATACFVSADKASGAIVGMTNANWNVTFQAWSQ